MRHFASAASEVMADHRHEWRHPMDDRLSLWESEWAFYISLQKLYGDLLGAEIDRQMSENHAREHQHIDSGRHDA